MHPDSRVAGRTLIAAIVFLAACDSSTTETAEASRWMLGEELLRIGSLDDSLYALAPVGDLDVGPDGDVYVAQSQAHLVRVFSADGTFVRDWGKEGEGPGEFKRVGRMGFLGDSLWVIDAGNRRINLFRNPQGFIGSFRLPQVADLPEGLTQEFAEPARDGGAFMTTAAAFRGELEGTDHAFPILRVDSEGVMIDTLGHRYTAHDLGVLVEESGGQIRSVQIFEQKFSDVTLWAVTPDQGMVLVDRRIRRSATPPTIGVHRLDASGETVYRVTIPYVPTPVPGSVVDSLISRYAAGGTDRGKIREILFLPPTYPPVARVLVARDGSVWMSRAGPNDEPVEWMVLDRQGVLVATLQVPRKFKLYVIESDTMWGVETDELDVPYVVAHELEKEELP